MSEFKAVVILMWVLIILAIVIMLVSCSPTPKFKDAESEAVFISARATFLLQEAKDKRHEGEGNR